MIILFGATGSGKSVQGQLLAQKYGWEWISSRDLFLGAKDKDIQRALQYGMTVDDEAASKILQRVLKDAHRSGKRLILDGFPTSVHQVYWMVEHGEIKNVECALTLRVPQGELWKRLMERKRIDDTRAAIERRSALYDRAVTGIMRKLSMNDIPVRDIDGRNTPEDVLERIEEVLGELGIIQRKQFDKISRAA